MTSPASVAPALSGIVESPDGSRSIPGSVRADGSARKEIRIRPGFTPAEDIGKYRPPTQRNGSSSTPDGKHRMPVNGALIRTPRTERRATSEDSECALRSSPTPVPRLDDEKRQRDRELQTTIDHERKLAADRKLAKLSERQWDSEKASEITLPALESLRILPATEPTPAEKPAVDPAKKLRALRWNLEQARILEEQANSGVAMLPEAQARIDSIPSLEAKLSHLSI